MPPKDWNPDKYKVYVIEYEEEKEGVEDDIE